MSEATQTPRKPGPPGNGGEPTAAKSLLDQVREQLERDTADETLDLRLPRKQPALVARYRVIDPDEVTGDDTVTANVSMLSLACVGIFLLDDKGDLKPLGEDGPAVTYATIGQELGLGTNSVRETILRLFKENQIAFRTHADRVAGWMQDTSREVEGEVLGESSA